METTMELLSNYQKELEENSKTGSCPECNDRGYYIVFNAYEGDKEFLTHCECLLGQMFIDNKLKALNSPAD